jgi:hypothetical protein
MLKNRLILRQSDCNPFREVKVWVCRNPLCRREFFLTCCLDPALTKPGSLQEAVLNLPASDQWVWLYDDAVVQNRDDDRWQVLRTAVSGCLNCPASLEALQDGWNHVLDCFAGNAYEDALAECPKCGGTHRGRRARRHTAHVYVPSPAVTTAASRGISANMPEDLAFFYCEGIQKAWQEDVKKEPNGFKAKILELLETDAWWWLYDEEAVGDRDSLPWHALYDLLVQSGCPDTPGSLVDLQDFWDDVLDEFGWGLLPEQRND